MPVVEQFIKLKEAADLLGVHIRTLYRLIADGQFPRPLKVRGCSVVPLSAVSAYQEKIMRGISR
ncbi:MAG: helix-turn-helix domain-containing protein [Phycisphaeraceae bacterium]